MNDAFKIPHRGGLILALGIISLLVCSPVGIAAWVMGRADLAAMDAGTMDPEGRQLTNAGMICGIIATILMALSIIGVLIAVAVGFTASLAGAGAGY